MFLRKHCTIYETDLRIGQNTTQLNWCTVW